MEASNNQRIRFMMKMPRDYRRRLCRNLSMTWRNYCILEKKFRDATKQGIDENEQDKDRPQEAGAPHHPEPGMDCRA